MGPLSLCGTTCSEAYTQKYNCFQLSCPGIDDEEGYIGRSQKTRSKAIAASRMDSKKWDGAACLRTFRYESRARNRQSFRNDEHRNESNRSRVEPQKIDSEPPIRIATCQCLAATLELHNSDRTVLNRPKFRTADSVPLRLLPIYSSYLLQPSFPRSLAL